MIKNYTSDSKNTFDKITKILVDHRAKNISYDYDGNGKIKTLIFVLSINGKDFGFKLPARVEGVEAIFFKSKKTRYDWEPKKPLTDAEKDQAYRTAWANIRDWLDAQMALIDTEQVKMEEVFLPYMVDSQGQTYFEHLEKQQFLLEGSY